MADKKKAMLVVDADLVPKIQRQFPAITDVGHPAIVDDNVVIVFTVDVGQHSSAEAHKILSAYRDGMRKLFDENFAGRKIPFVIVAHVVGQESLQVVDEERMAELGWHRNTKAR